MGLRLLVREVLMTESDRPRLCVFGTRTFQDRSFLFKTLDRLTVKLVKPVILTGGGWYWVKDQRGFPIKVGVDVFAEEWAFQHYHTVMRFCPDFDKYKSPECYHVRNREMVEELVRRRPCYALGIWDGKSPGTKGMIALCQRYKVDHLKVIRVSCPEVASRSPRRQVGRGQARL